MAYRGRISNQTQPLAYLGPALPGQLLVSAFSQTREGNTSFFRRWVQVIDERGENTNGWRLPSDRDAGDPKRTANYVPLFAGGLILMVDNSTGTILAYEHDPGNGKKTPGD